MYVPVKCLIEASFLVPVSFKISCALIPCNLKSSQLGSIPGVHHTKSPQDINTLFDRVRVDGRGPTFNGGCGERSDRRGRQRSERG